MAALLASFGSLWHASNEIHVSLGLGHWLVFTALLTVVKLAYASHRDGVREGRERRARR